MKRALQLLKEQAGQLVDTVSDFTGYVAVRVPLQKASRPGEVTLDLTGYRQVNSYACGAVAAAMVVKFLRPPIGYDRIHNAVDPCQEIGAGTMRVTRALRSLGIGVARKTKLTFDDIAVAIKAGRPVLACVTTRDPNTNHWVVIYGYGRRPKLVFVAGQGWPFIGRQRMTWPQFRRQWAPPGEGIVCWKAKPRKTVRSSRPVKKK
ncbi:MAG: C39 family peptidase [Verrucomicrobia bacterium]|nr:C39 family peptidase [Verrucomicrobiota bacterium]